MSLRLRQICLVASQLEPMIETLTSVFGLAVGHRDPGLDIFGLENALLPVGNSFLEVVAPIQKQTAAERYLKRRKGNGGYMVITQCEDLQPRQQHVEKLGIRLVHHYWETEKEILWKTVQESIPPLKKVIQELLEKENQQKLTK